jgi:hypothetical protein
LKNKKEKVMIVMLDPSDLKKEYQKNDGQGVPDSAVETHEVNFHMLTEHAQTVVRIIGIALYTPWDRNSVKAIFPPK